MSIPLGVGILLVAFVCEYMDSTLGMGYGTSLTPMLMLLGFTPIQIVPVVLLSELLSGLSAAVLHHRSGNVNLRPSNADFLDVRKALRPLGYIDNIRQTFPLHLKVALLLALCGILGTLVGVMVAFKLPIFWVKIYIACLVISMGVIILICLDREIKFAWSKVAIIGAIASFNKGISGGGYGPVVTGGQMLSGIEGKVAVGITSLAEGLTCFVGILAYLWLAENAIDWSLAPWVIGGAMLSVPFATISVRKMSPRTLKVAISIVTIALGVFVLLKTLLS